MATKKQAGVELTPADIKRRYPTMGFASEICVTPDKLLWLPSSVLALNWQTGGGMPYGRIVESAGEESTGKTLLGLDYAKNAQKLGGICLFADSEATFDRYWAEKNGVDLSKTLLLPNENIIEVVSDWSADMSVTYRKKLGKGVPIVLVWDSMAAWETRANMEAADDDSGEDMGRRAKKIFQLLRKRAKIFADNDICVYSINQLRKKVGASKWEDPDCLHQDVKVKLRTGEVHTIGEIVNKKIQGEVLSYNFTKDIFEYKAISGWVRKPHTKKTKWLHILTDGPGSTNGFFGIICTRKHLIYEEHQGWINAKNIRVGDRVLSQYNSIINEGLESFLLGSFIGDSSLRVRGKNTATYKLRDSINPEYRNWKVEMLRPFIPMHPNGAYYQSDYSVEMAEWKKLIGNRDPLTVIQRNTFNAISLAIWFMDDGCTTFRRGDSYQVSISISHKRTNLAKLCEALLTKFDIDSSPKKSGKGILLTLHGANRLFDLIYAWVPPSMHYKLPNEYARRKQTPLNLSHHTKKEKIWVEVINVSTAGDRNHNSDKYDLTIEDNHNFIAGSVSGGFIVHNTTPGGGAMKYFASIRSRLYKSKVIKDEKTEEPIGSFINIRHSKSKVAPLRKTIKARVFFQETNGILGYDPYWGFADILQEVGIIERRRGLFYRKGKLLARGEEAFDSLIREDTDFRALMIKKLGINTVSRTREMM